jgi:cell shape-determining protein MreC
MSDQRMPTPGGRAVTPIARDQFDMILSQQEAKGIATYGMSLTTNNGRDACLDALQELVDAFQYVVQARIEYAELVAENQRLRAEIARLEGQRP